MRALGHILAATLILSCPATAHNLGFTALAAPVDSITVDGDLSDWPDDLPTYRLGAVLKGYPTYDSRDPAPDDLTAWFQVAWSPRQDRLFVAVIVIDSETVLGNSPNNTDAIEIYLDGRHEGEDPQQYLMFPGEATYRLFGTATNPTLSGGDALAAGAMGEHQAVGDTNVYELSLQVFGASVSEPLLLTAGERIAFDAVAVDMDPDATGATWLSWSPQGGKVSNLSRTGDVWLLKSEGVLQEMSKIRGRVAIPGGTGWRGMVVRLRDGDGRSWSTAITGPDGEFEVIGRSGEMILEVEEAEPPLKRTLTLTAGESVDLSLDVLGRTGNQLPVWPLAVSLGLLSSAAVGALMPLRRRLDLLGGVLIAPLRTFEALAQRPDWTAPAALILLSAALASVAGINLYPGQLWGALMGASGQLAAVLLTSVPLLMLLALVVFQFAGWLVWSLILWTGARLAGGQGRFFHVVAVAGYASVPAVIGLCVASLQATFFGGDEVLRSPSTGLGLFADDAVWRAVLSRIELFNLWSWGLGSVALASVMSISRRRSLLVGLAAWLCALCLLALYHHTMQSVAAAMAEIS